MLKSVDILERGQVREAKRQMRGRWVDSHTSYSRPGGQISPSIVPNVVGVPSTRLRCW